MANQTSPNQALANSTANDLLEEISRQSKALDQNVPESDQAACVRDLAQAFALVVENDNRANSGSTALNGYRQA